MKLRYIENIGEIQLALHLKEKRLWDKQNSCNLLSHYFHILDIFTVPQKKTIIIYIITAIISYRIFRDCPQMNRYIILNLRF